MIVSSDKQGRIDPVWFNFLKHVDSKYPIVPITKIEGFEFNEDLYKLDAWILVCGCEYGWNFPLEKTGTHIWGQSFKHFGFGVNDLEWVKFDEFVAEKPPLLVFKRELVEGFQPENYFPINYPCWHEIPEVQSNAQFDNREFQCNFIWGLSHEYRKTLHGQIWQRAGEFGYVVCDNIDKKQKDLFLEHENNPKKWVAANIPWYSRKEMSEIIELNGQSKISISINGAGRHCFRDSESPINSVMYRWEDKIKFSYPWVSHINCIKSKQGEEIETIVTALAGDNLYSVYCEGVENCKKYFLPTYIKNYIEPIINEA